MVSCLSDRETFPRKPCQHSCTSIETTLHNALWWLKQNNPIYRNIIISSSRLQKLPFDAVPSEIVDTAKHCDDLARLAEERDRYVPKNDDCDDGSDGVDDNLLSDDEDITQNDSSHDCGVCFVCGRHANCTHTS